MRRALLVALLLVGSASAWPMFQGDHRNQGSAPGLEAATQPWWTWSAPDDHRIDAAPVVGAGVVVVADWEGLVTALDAESGRPLWSHRMAGKVVSTPAIALGWVYVADLKGELVALDLRDGRLMASATVGPTQAPITIKEAKVFIGNEEGEMQALTATTLDLLWSFNVADAGEASLFNNVTKVTTCPAASRHPERPIRTAAAVHAGMVVFGSMNHYVYAVDERGRPDGTTVLQWRHRTDDIVLASPVIDAASQRVFVASYGETVRSLPLLPATAGSDRCFGADVVPTWSFAVPGPVDASKVHATPASDMQRLYFGTNHGTVYAVAAGAEVWRLEAAAPVLASAVVSNGIVVVGSDDGRLRWLDAASGAVLAMFQADGPIKSGAAIHGGTVIVATETGTVYRLGGTPPARADLAVVGMAPEGPGIIITIRNVGAAASEPARVQVWANGTMALEETIAALAPSQEAQVFYFAPSTGVIVLEAVIDPEQELLEAGRENNALSEAVVVGEAEEQGTVVAPADKGRILGLTWWVWAILAAVLVGGGTGGWLWWRLEKVDWYADEASSFAAFDGEFDEEP